MKINISLEYRYGTRYIQRGIYALEDIPEHDLLVRNGHGAYVQESEAHEPTEAIPPQALESVAHVEQAGDDESQAEALVEHLTKRRKKTPNGGA